MSINSGHTMELSVDDIKGFFKKKKCRKCGDKLKKVSISKDIGIRSVDIGMSTFKGETKEHKILYHCKNCDITYKLSDL